MIYFMNEHAFERLELTIDALRRALDAVGAKEQTE